MPKAIKDIIMDKVKVQKVKDKLIEKSKETCKETSKEKLKFIDTSKLNNVKCYMYTTNTIYNLEKYFEYNIHYKKLGLDILEASKKAISMLDKSEFMVEHVIYFGYPYFVQVIINSNTKKYIFYKSEPFIHRENTVEGYFDNVLKSNKDPLYLELRKSLDIIKNVKSNKYSSNQIMMSVMSSNLNSSLYVNLHPKPLVISESEYDMLNIDIEKTLEDVPTFEELYNFSNRM